jgi:hypothetical protein
LIEPINDSTRPQTFLSDTFLDDKILQQEDKSTNCAHAESNLAHLRHALLRLEKNSYLSIRQHGPLFTWVDKKSDFLEKSDFSSLARKTHTNQSNNMAHFLLGLIRNPIFWKNRISLLWLEREKLLKEIRFFGKIGFLFSFSSLA